LGTYINTLDPQATTTVLGVSISAGLIIGMYTTGFTLAQTVAVVPLAWAGDRFDKRTVLLGVLAIGAGVYALFPLVDSSASFILVRALQGLVVTGAGLMTLSLVGQIADVGTRADKIGKANAASFAASIVGSLSAGAIYDAVGFDPIFMIIALLMVAAWVITWLVLDDDDTRVEGFPFSDLAVNRRILTMTSFRAQYAFAVTMVRTWVPIYVSTEMAAGGLGVTGIAIGVTVTAEGDQHGRPAVHRSSLGRLRSVPVRLRRRRRLRADRDGDPVLGRHRNRARSRGDAPDSGRTAGRVPAARRLLGTARYRRLLP